MSESVVSVVKDPNPDKAVRESLRLLGGVGSFINRGDKVLIKPNLSFPIPPEEAPDTTHPEVIAALIRVFEEGGAGRVIVGEQSVWGVRTRDTCRITGVEEVVKETGGELCYFDEEPRIIVNLHGKFFDEISLPKIIKEVDLIVNVPKMKNNFMSVVTLGMKNHMGFMTFEDRRKLHRKYDLAYTIADIVKVVSPGLTLIDGIIAMEGFGPHAGTPIRMDTVIGGRDIVAVDAVGASVMGYDPLEPPTTQVGVRYSLGNADLSKIQIVGEPLERVRKYFKRPIIMAVSPHPNVEVYPGGMCPGCAPRIPKIPLNPDPNKKYAVIIGRRAKVPRKLDEYDEVWCFGKCGMDSAMGVISGVGKEKIKLVPGCPPLIWYGEQTVLKTLKEKGWAYTFDRR